MKRILSLAAICCCAIALSACKSSQPAEAAPGALGSESCGTDCASECCMEKPEVCPVSGEPVDGASLGAVSEAKSECCSAGK